MKPPRSNIPKKKKWEFPIGLEPMTAEAAQKEVDDFFAQLEAQYKDVPDVQLMEGVKKVQSFLKGEIGWAGLFNFTPEMLHEMAEFGFMQLKLGRYTDAERVFKVLTVLDWGNAYYHAVMGSILQREKRHGDALAEYEQALELDPRDIPSYTNRGEILMQHGLLDDAEKDFVRAIALDPEGSDRFANRARMLLVQLMKNREAKATKG